MFKIDFDLYELELSYLQHAMRGLRNSTMHPGTCHGIKIFTVLERSVFHSYYDALLRTHLMGYKCIKQQTDYWHSLLSW